MLGEEHKDTLASLDNFGALLREMGDCEGALDFYQQALRVQEKGLGKTHPDTVRTIMNMSNMYRDVTKDFIKAEELYRLALDGYEKSLGKEHEDTERCAMGLGS